MPKLIDLSGGVYGLLKVVSWAGKNRHGQHLWKCHCQCGQEAIVVGHRLRYGATRSCGCLHGEKHGLSGTRAYRIWTLMRDRCSNSNSPAWENYGGRGIAVDGRWESFSRFLADMGHPPDGHELDRRDNNGPYSPENCRWVSRMTQANNKRTTIFIESGGRVVSLAEACRARGVRYKTAWQRMSRGQQPFVE